MCYRFSANKDVCVNHQCSMIKMGYEFVAILFRVNTPLAAV